MLWRTCSSFKCLKYVGQQQLHMQCNSTSEVQEGWGVHNLTPTLCEGRETVSDIPLAQVKYIKQCYLNDKENYMDFLKTLGM